MLIFIAGGAKSGKSHYAQDVTVRLAAGGRRYYIATMIPVDAEDEKRIEAHVADRAGLGFETALAPRNLPELLSRVEPDSAFLLDSATALFMNELYPDPTTWAPDEDAARRTAEDILAFAKGVQHLVVVSDQIYSDAIRYSPETETFRRGLAYIDRAVARSADTVLEMAAGNIIVHKGELPR